jgi:hypothetical protein
LCVNKYKPARRPQRKFVIGPEMTIKRYEEQFTLLGFLKNFLVSKAMDVQLLRSLYLETAVLQDFYKWTRKVRIGEQPELLGLGSWFPPQTFRDLEPAVFEARVTPDLLFSLTYHGSFGYPFHLLESRCHSQETSVHA